MAFKAGEDGEAIFLFGLLEPWLTSMERAAGFGGGARGGANEFPDARGREANEALDNAPVDDARTRADSPLLPDPREDFGVRGVVARVPFNPAHADDLALLGPLGARCSDGTVSAEAVGASCITNRQGENLILGPIDTTPTQKGPDRERAHNTYIQKEV